MSKEEETAEDYEGQLAIDVYQTNNAIVVQAPIAGVTTQDLEVSVSDEMVSIKGERKPPKDVKRENYLCQECYWGSFSRSYLLPVAVDISKAKADLKDGVLTITIPKQEASKTKILKISTE